MIVRAMSKFGGISASAIPVEVVHTFDKDLSNSSYALHATQSSESDGAADPKIDSHAYAIIKCPSDDSSLVIGAIGGAIYEQFCIRVLENSNYLSFLV